MKANCLLRVGLLCLMGPGFCAGASNYVQLSDSGRYFQLEDGSNFVPIGQNEGVDWPHFINCYPTAVDHYDPTVLRNYFDLLRDHRVNVVRLMTAAPGAYTQWLDQPDGIQLEKPVGVINPRMVTFLDHVFEAAADYGIYLMITPYDTYWMNGAEGFGSEEWGQNAYNSANGGPVHTAHDFLTEKRVLQYQMARMSFLIDRYGNSDYIFAWDFMNELDIWWDSSEQEEQEFTNRMTNFITQYERAKWGRNHLVCISTAVSNPGGALGYATYAHPNVDFPTTHMYYGAGGSRPSVADPETAIGSGVFDVITPAVQVNGGIKYQLSQIPVNDPRPYLDSESGPIDYWGRTDGSPLPTAVDHEYYHNMIWAHLASGGAGSNLRWPHQLPHTLDGAMHDLQKAMGKVAEHVDWSQLRSQNIDSDLSGSNADGKTVITMGCGDGYTAVLFLLHDLRSSSGTVSGAQLHVAAMQPGEYRIQVFDTYSAELLMQSTAIASDGTVSLNPLPDFERSVAVVLTNATSSASINAKPGGIITSPKALRAVSQSPLTISAEAWDRDGSISKVEFYAEYDDGTGRDWRLLGQDAEGADNYTLDWDISGLADQTVSISIDVYDDAGMSVRPAYVLYEVELEHNNGDDTPPYGSIEWPGSGRTIANLSAVTLRAGAWDDSSGVKRVDFWIQGSPADPDAATDTWLGGATEPPYEITVDLSAYDGTTRWISLDVTDNADNFTGPADLHSDIVLDSTPTDNEPPIGHFVGIASGDVIARTPLHLTVEASDRLSGIDRVQVYAHVDGAWRLLGEDSTPPYEFTWNGAGSSQLVDFTCDIWDNAGNSLRPASAIANLHYTEPDGDTTPPWGHIANLVSESTATLPMTLEAVAGDVVSAVAQVAYKYRKDAGWQMIGTATERPFAIPWTGDGLSSGDRVDVAIDVLDTAGNLRPLADIKASLTVERAGDEGGDDEPPDTDAHLKATGSGPTVMLALLVAGVASCGLVGRGLISWRLRQLLARASRGARP